MNRRHALRAIGSSITAGGVVSVGAAGCTSAATGSYTDEYLGGYHYTKYVPSGASGGEPLLVMLHGCTQSPDEFARATRMNTVAEENGFVVIYPNQSSFANGYECWNWFYDAHTERGYGEGATITDMASHEISGESLDSSRVYVAGFSAGAAMVPNLLVAYPDVYAAGGVHSGLEYDAADTASGGTYAMSYGGPDPYYQGEEAYAAMQANGIVGHVPTVVFHGTADGTVAPVNGDQATIQAIETNDHTTDGADDGNIDTTPEDETAGTTGGYDWNRRQFADETGTTYVEYWEVTGMGHAWSGGDGTEGYTASGAPDASRKMWEFFSHWTL